MSWRFPIILPLGKSCMLDLKERHLARLITHSIRFSMAIVGINITDFALQLVRTRQLQYFLYKYGTTKTMFEEFYCKCPHDLIAV